MDARVRLGQLLTGIVAALLVMTAAPLTVAGGGPPADVGDYVGDGTVHDLTSEHVQSGPGTVAVDAPVETSEVRVNVDYLQDRLGDFAADRPFTVASGSVVVESDEVIFTTFTPGPDEVFTVGSDDNLRFLDRPMWVSVEPIENGIDISAHDGHTSGQDIRLDAGWLSNYGVTAPVAVHHDGTVLDVEISSDGSAFIVDVPHFSHIQILNPNLDDSWKVAGWTIWYDAFGPSQTSEFQVTLIDVTGSELSFQQWATKDGVDRAFFNETYDDANGRESVNRTGYYSLNYINNAQLSAGEAMLGTTMFDLELQTTTAWVFSSGDLSYHFHIDQGWLMKVVDDGNGASIEKSASGTGGPIVSPGPGGQTIAQLTSPSQSWTYEITWDEAASDLDDHLVPNWNGGTADETISGNILLPSQHVTVRADITVRAMVDAGCNDSVSCDLDNIETCLEVDTDEDCHIWSMAEKNDLDDIFDHGWVVRFDDFRWDMSEIIATCVSVNDCPFSTVHLNFENSASAAMESLAGEINQPSLLEPGEAPFWACAIGKYWDHRPDTEAEKANPQQSESLCKTPPGSSSPNTGVVRVDPFHDLP